MVKTLLKQIGGYKKDTIITPIFTVLEVVAEVLVPFVIASPIDKGIEAGNLRNVYLYGALMIVLAFFRLGIRCPGRTVRGFCFCRFCLQPAPEYV